MTHEERRKLMGLFSSFVDNVLDDRNMRIACCMRWGEFYDKPGIGDGMASYADEHFHGFADLIRSLREWPDEQLRLLTGALLQVIGCPRNPRPPKPGPWPLPDPIIRPSFEARYGETHGITISLRGPNRMHIVFERPDFERPED